MKLINKYILFTLIKNFSLTIFLFLFLGLLTRIFHYSSIVTEDGGSIKDLLTVLLLIQPKILTVLMPFAALIASFITYNNMIHANEHVIIYNAGISEFGILKPLFYFSFLLFLLNLFFSIYLVPKSYFLMNDVYNKVALQATNSFLKPKQFSEQKGLLIFINQASQKTAEGIVIVNTRKKNEKSILIANKGQIGFNGSMVLFDSTETYISRNNDFSNNPLIINFAKYKITLFLSQSLDFAPRKLISSLEIWRSVKTGKTVYMKDFKNRFGWPFFSILIPLAISVCLLYFFNFTRSKVEIKKVIITALILSYTVLSGIFGEMIFNSKTWYLFLYYGNIFLIFIFLLFILKRKFLK